MIKFDEEKHEYWFKDRQVPSVTKILKDLNDFSKIPKGILEQKGLLGTEFHRIIKMHFDDDLIYDSIDERLLPAFDSFLSWSKPRLKEFRAGLSEQRLFDEKLWLAGTCDLALPAELFDWKLRPYKPVIDILQLEGYDTLLKGGKRKRWTVCFDMKSGKMSVNRSEHKQSHTMFMAMLKHYRVRQGWIEFFN